MSDTIALRFETGASILKSRIELDALRCEVQELAARVHETFSRSRQLIAETDKLLMRR